MCVVCNVHYLYQIINCMLVILFNLKMWFMYYWKKSEAQAWYKMKKKMATHQRAIKIEYSSSKYRIGNLTSEYFAMPLILVQIIHFGRLIFISLPQFFNAISVIPYTCASFVSEIDAWGNTLAHYSTQTFFFSRYICVAHI